jgi:hypothetical protein
MIEYLDYLKFIHVVISKYIFTQELFLKFFFFFWLATKWDIV